MTEVPRWQQTAPEGLCLAAYINLWVHVAVMVVPLQYFLMRSFPNAVNDANTVAVLLVLELLALVFLTATWQVSTKVVLAFSFVGGSIGSLSCVVLVPFVTRTHPENIEDAMFGMRGVSLLASIVGLVQQPGSEHMHLSSTVFLGLFILPLCCTILAFAYTQKHTEKQSKQQSLDLMKLSSAIDTSMPTVQMLERGDRHAALREASALLGLLGWANFHCWGLVPSVLPFAAKHTDSSGVGSECLQYVLLLGTVALFFGSVVALVAKCRHVFSLSLVYTACTVVVYCAAFDTPFGFWPSSAGGPLLVVVHSLSKFLEAYIVTMVYVIISERFVSQRIYISRAAGFVDRAATTIGTFCSIGLLHALSRSGVAHAHACFQ
jgi:hypothetical protein